MTSNLATSTSSDPSREKTLSNPAAGLPLLCLAILCLPATITCFVQADQRRPDSEVAMWAIGGMVCLLLGVFLLRGLVLVNPNQSKVILLFGRYVGTIRHDGLFWVNPFTVRPRVSLRAHNFNSDTLKVNDLDGNPIEIGAVVVWRVRDTAQASFDVEDYESYVAVQTESALRHMSASHPYDAEGGDQASLRGSADIVNRELHQELTNRLTLAGIEILEARLSHLAYAPEIAGAMLQRQQAEAIIAARTRIVDGAVGMVQMALDHLQQRGIVDLDEERRATMVSNLLVVLCSERGTTPVVNAGSLY